MSDFVKIVEVGPRDGLQNEAATVPVAVRIRLIDLLSATGLRVIEAGAFVSPVRVPQMADSPAVLAGIRRFPGVTYPVLVPNLKGLEAALDATGVEEIAIFGSASEAFSQRNINSSIAESLDRFAAVTEAARAHGLRVRGYVSCALGCPYEGEVAPARVAEMAGRLAELGCYEVSIADTIGAGTPDRVRTVILAVAERVPIERLAVHCHDTRGHGLANVAAALETGIRVVDAAVAGLGGCPFAAGAPGNVGTEQVLRLVGELGFVTGVAPDKVEAAGRFISRALGRA